jgi:hypothetical protein
VLLVRTDSVDRPPQVRQPVLGLLGLLAAEASAIPLNLDFGVQFALRKPTASSGVRRSSRSGSEVCSGCDGGQPAEGRAARFVASI